MTSKPLFIGYLGLIVFMASPLPAQEKPAAGKNKVRVSLIAVGDLPPVRYRDTDKGPIWVEPPKEDFPPPVLYVKDSSKDGSFAQLQLGLNTPMPPIEHPGGKIMTVFEDKNAATDTEQDASTKASYLNVPLPDAKVDLTVFLTRDRASKSWRTSPQSYAFKSDTATFPPNYVRLINFTSSPVQANISGTMVNLGPAGGDSSVKIVKATRKNRVLRYAIRALVKDKPVILANTATSFFDGSRLNMAIYEGDGAGTIGHLKLCTFQEPVPQPARDNP